nr:succinylglutamate desuccinylase/aspartoacylase family protein [Halovivax sp. TS33]
MGRHTFHRRSFLAVTAGFATTGVAIAQTDDDSSVSRGSFELLPGTDHETTVYETRTAADGPTVLVVGGIHGNEIAGYRAAARIADWDIDAGTLVTIPEANTVAIDDGTRTGTDAVDLNRQFPTGSEPRTELARAIWDVVLEYDPDVVIDLHESIGIYDDDPVDGVGQAIFHSPSGETSADADEAAAFVNENDVDDPSLAFQTGYFTGPDMEPNGLFVHKAQREVDANSFLVETLSTDVDLETRIRWHTALVRQLVDEKLFLEGRAVPDTDGEGKNEDEESGESVEDEDEGEESDDPAGDEDGESDEPAEDGDGESDEPDGDEDEGEESDEPVEDGDGESDDSTSETPTARIRTIPAWIDVTALEPGEEFELDASASSTPAERIDSYEWNIGDDGDVDSTDETVSVSAPHDGAVTVVLSITDCSGATDTEELVLSTA